MRRVPGWRILATIGGTMNVVYPLDGPTRSLGDRSDAASHNDEIVAMVARAEADVATGRFVTISGPADSEALHDATMARLRARIAEGRSVQ